MDWDAEMEDSALEVAQQNKEDLAQLPVQTDLIRLAKIGGGRSSKRV
jgi:hypothetical protein